MSDYQATALLDRPIAFHRSFVTLTGSVTAALMLSQAVYWQRRTDDRWWYKTTEAWTEETGMSRHEIDGARKVLRKFAWWHEERRGLPAKLWYRVDLDLLLRELCAPANKFAENRQTGMPESGSKETNTETNKIPPLKGKTVDVRKAVEIWNEICGPLLGRVRKLTPARRSSLLARINGELGGLDEWEAYCRRIRASPFLRGDATRWRADFDWVIKQKSCIRILEGRYDERERSRSDEAADEFGSFLSGEESSVTAGKVIECEAIEVTEAAQAPPRRLPPGS